MKKTFRKALACLLAVLMVAFSVPFSALAYEVGHTVGEANYQWWDDANPPKARPDYTSFNSTYVFGRTLAKAILTNEKNGNYSKRWDAKPVVGATVSYLGTENDTLEDLEAKLHTYYGKVGYAEAEAAGVIMNPTEIKAGQRIAVTYEFGGLDVMNNGQILSTYDNTKLAAAGYWDEYIIDNDMDTWDFEHTADYGKAAITNSTMSVVPNMDDTEAKVSLLANVAAQTSSSAAFVGNYTDMDAVYGVPVATFFFEALQDCDLTEAITFTEGRGGTVFEWGSEDTGFKDGLKAITFTPEVDSFILFAPPIWTNASSTPAPETHKHDYKSEVTTPATCTKEGVMTYTCQSTTGTCDRPSYTEAIAIDPTAHTAAAERVNVKEASCTEAGYTGDVVCKDCGAVIEKGTEVPKADHVAAAELANVKAATCETAGYTGDKVCKNCGATLEEGTVITKLGHNYTSEVTTPATCTSEGVRTWTCQNPEATCELHSYTETIAKLDHVAAAERVNVKEASCTEAGYTGDVVCKDCGTVLEQGEEVPMTAHVAAEELANVKAATCTEAGYSGDVVCKDCGTVITAGHATDPLDHDFSVVLSSTAADCQTKGTTTYKCSRCEETKTVDGGYGPHGEGVEDEGVVTTEPTCTTLGVKTFKTKCPICGEVLSTRTEEIAMIAHNGVEDEGVVTTEPTCTTLGVKTFTTKCSVCGEVLSTRTEDIAMIAHNGVEDEGVVTTEPTCTTLGVKTFTTKCSECGEVLSTRTEDIAMTEHVAGEPEVTRVEATVDADGSVTTIVKCVNCGKELSKNVEVLPMLKSYTVTVDAADMGTVTLAGTDVTNGGSAKFVPGSKVTLTAEAFDGAKFIGWTANGSTLVSTDAEFTTTVLANVKYTPVFEVATDDVFTVTFVDAFGNVVAVCTSDKGIDVPAAPARPGYVAATENGWSMTNDEIKALTSSATVTAQYVKAEEATYTVKAAGCDITANGQTIADELSVPYDTKVTVTNTSATAWIVKDAKTGEEVKVAYGDSYTFFVTADITLTYDTEAVVATPQVANVGVEAVGTAPRIQAAFKATRTMADDCQYIASGFVYGKGDLGAITLDNVDGRAVKASYNKTDSEQFILTYGLSAQQGTMTAVAFLAYVDANGVNQVAYAAPMTFTY